MRNTHATALRSLVLSFGLAFACAAVAQTPAVSPQEAAQAKQQAAQQLVQPLNNQPVWKEVRSGEPQFTGTRGREADILIQPGGQTWRALRDGQISIYGGWALVVIFLAITAFYWRRGTIQLDSPPTGRKVKRFSAWERSVHWATAGSFVVLAISGLIILFGKSVLLPLIGYTLFSWLAAISKTLHNFVGPLFSVCVVLLFFTFVRDNFFKRHDAIWFRKLGGLVSGEHVPSDRFNGGEKVWFWGGVLLLGTVVSVSGLILDFPNFNQTRQTMQIANIVHSVGAILFTLGAMGHIYIGTIGMEGAIDGMSTGYVDETWAKEHHEYWYNDVKAGRIVGEGVAPAVAQRAA